MIYIKDTGKVDAAEAALAEAIERACAAHAAWKEHQNKTADLASCKEQHVAPTMLTHISTIIDETCQRADEDSTASCTGSDIVQPDSSSVNEGVAVVVAAEELLQHKQEADDALREAMRVHELTTKAAQMTLWQRACMLMRTFGAWLLLWNGFMQGFGLGMVRKSTPHIQFAISTCVFTHSTKASYSSP